jgi:AcrR family transcriptional regulator
MAARTRKGDDSKRRRPARPGAGVSAGGREVAVQPSRPVTSARAGTAVQSKGRQRAEEILAAARAVLVEEGYASLTTRKVAQRVGIRLSNVQYYYPTKVELVRALFEHSVGERAQAVALGMDAGKRSARDRLLWAVDQFLASHHSLEHQAFLRELWALAAHDPEVAEVKNVFYQRWVDLGAQVLLEIDPELGQRKAQRRALLIVSLVDGLSLFHGAAGIDHPARKGIEKELRELVDGLAKSPKRR